MKRAQPEAALQKCVAQLLDHLGWLYCHPAGEWILRGTKEERARQMQRMKRAGWKPGQPDVMVYERWSKRMNQGAYDWMAEGHGVAIELKAGRNTTTPDQDRWLEELRDRGWLTAVCRTVDEVRDVLRHVQPRNGRRL